MYVPSKFFKRNSEPQDQEWNRNDRNRHMRLLSLPELILTPGSWSPRHKRSCPSRASSVMSDVVMVTGRDVFLPGLDNVSSEALLLVCASDGERKAGTSVCQALGDPFLPSDLMSSVGVMPVFKVKIHIQVG